METKNHENSTLGFLTEGSTISSEINVRERIKIEFYKTYDVMTGIRIAATLGGFFSMMILLVLYKNYCKPSKTLSEEQLNAAVTAAAEEEDRALQAALEATSFYTSLSNPRQSIGNANHVLLSPRFSSVGGGYSHLSPPLKMAVLQQRGKSLPGSVMQFNSNENSLCTQKLGKTKEDSGYLPDFSGHRNQLNVPLGRRVSSVTCSSTDSSYLERRCSAFEVPFSFPHSNKYSQEKLSEQKETRGCYYPIDIQVIQPTPEMSPTASERNLFEDQSICGLQVPGFQDQLHRLSVSSIDFGLAPLASISSLGSFSSHSSSLMSKSHNTTSNNSTGNQICTCGEDSMGSDSVFMDEAEMEDDEMEGFGTDSEFEYDGFDDDYSFCEAKPRTDSKPEMRTVKFASFDSYDASIVHDDIVSEEETVKTAKQSEEKLATVCSSQHVSDLKGQTSFHEGNKANRKLVKTYSDPKSNKILKQLPPWTEKGRSGYLPKRQLSSPTRRKKLLLEVSKRENEPTETTDQSTSTSAPKILPQEDEISNNFPKLLLQPPTNTTNVQIVQSKEQIPEQKSTSTQKQGFKEESPSKSCQKLSSANTQEKRSRLQKQKNFIEEIKVTNQTKEKTEEQHLTGNEDSIQFPTTAGLLLKPPNSTFTGSCEKLASKCEKENEQNLK